MFHWDAIKESWSELKQHVRWSRLYREDAGVVGVGWSKLCTDNDHELLNCLRLFFIMLFAPFYVATPRKVHHGVTNFFRPSWGLEFSATPTAILNSAPRPGGGRGQYEVSFERPTFMLRVDIKDGELTNRETVEWTEDLWCNNGYTAISYNFQCAEALLEATGGTLPPGPANEPGRRYDNEGRKVIAGVVLDQYLARVKSSLSDGTLYIWIDEYCASKGQVSEAETSQMRKREFGRLADIYRGAKNVCVCCSGMECDHTGLDCPWGNRLFTLAEILHAKHVVKMTRCRTDEGVVYRLCEAEDGWRFRERIQYHSSVARRWHLFAVMQHFGNAGAVPWQVAIHSLIVEVMRRDNAGGFIHHEYLGKGLNGLLPRRAHVDDLLGENGWADLIWLLELNQGFYNSAALAAVCSLPQDGGQEHAWLGHHPLHLRKETNA